MKSKVVGVAIGALLVAITATTAMAGHIGSDVKSYTGCLVPKDGVIIKIKEGDAPASPCTGGSTVVHFSGGDITKISVSGGLTLPNGGDNGQVTIALDPKYSLPQTCDDGQVAKWDDTDEAWKCADDEDTTYDAGIGLVLDEDSGGSVFRIDQDYRVKNTPDCPSGQFEDDGAIKCAPPASDGVKAYSAHVGSTTMAGDTLVISKTLPADRYLLFATGALVNQDGNAAEDEESEARCTIPGYDTGSVDLVRGDVETAETKVSVALSSAISHAGGAVELRCIENSADVDVYNATLTAIKVDSLG